ncbi:hypothetical protein HDU85_005586 [Gaertneriomyces sp. JEL0708]|nr:hypothetical protein HDU85_005586 [Gaertneriomyces sp. JEL0708]
MAREFSVTTLSNIQKGTMSAGAKAFIHEDLVSIGENQQQLWYGRKLTPNPSVLIKYQDCTRSTFFRRYTMSYMYYASSSISSISPVFSSKDLTFQRPRSGSNRTAPRSGSAAGSPLPRKARRSSEPGGSSSVQISLERNKVLTYTKDEVVARMVIPGSRPATPKGDNHAKETFYVLSFRKFPRAVSPNIRSAVDPAEGSSVTTLVLNDMRVDLKRDSVCGVLSFWTAPWVVLGVDKPASIPIAVNVAPNTRIDIVAKLRPAIKEGVGDSTPRKPASGGGRALMKMMGGPSVERPCSVDIGWDLYDFELPCGAGSPFAAAMERLGQDATQELNSRNALTNTYKIISSPLAGGAKAASSADNAVKWQVTLRFCASVNDERDQLQSAEWGVTAQMAKVIYTKPLKAGKRSDESGSDSEIVNRRGSDPSHKTGGSHNSISSDVQTRVIELANRASNVQLPIGSPRVASPMVSAADLEAATESPMPSKASDSDEQRMAALTAMLKDSFPNGKATAQDDDEEDDAGDASSGEESVDVEEEKSPRRRIQKPVSTFYQSTYTFTPSFSTASTLQTAALARRMHR